MKYFITGATGFIGGHLISQLLKENHEIHGLVRDPRRAQHLADLGVKLYQGDITHKESMKKGMEGVDGVFHLAAWYKIGARDRHRAYGINVLGTQNVLELMKEFDIPKGVYTSTLAVFSDTKGQIMDESYMFKGKHLSEYDRTKWIAHYKVALPMMEEGLPLTIVQPGAVYGPGDTSSVGVMLHDYLLGKLPMVPQNTALCWCHVDDVAQGHILAMNKGKPGESYIICGTPATLMQALNMAESITDIPGPKMKIHPGMIKLFSGFLKTIPNVLHLEGAYTGEGLRVIAGTTYLGNDRKARKELQFNPRPLNTGLEETLHQLMDEMEISREKIAA